MSCEIKTYTLSNRKVGVSAAITFTVYAYTQFIIPTYKIIYGLIFWDITNVGYLFIYFL